MRSFKVNAVAHLTVGDWDYVDVAELVCRSCETLHGVGSAAFVVASTPKVGQRLHCPNCGVRSIIPKRSRWTPTELDPGPDAMVERAATAMLKTAYGHVPTGHPHDGDRRMATAALGAALGWGS